MVVSGLTFIRNGIRLGYPFVEAIKSALPLCDEFIVVVGESDDGTREAVQGIADPKIKIIDTKWPSNIQPKQAVLAQQTNVGLLQCQGDWVVYVQGNELFHERDYGEIRALMEKHLNNDLVEGLAFERNTFFADYQHCYRVYPGRFKYTARIFKPWGGVYSVKDAMAFAAFDGYGRKGRDLRCVDTGFDIYRYGLVVTAEAYTAKLREAPHCARLGLSSFALNDYYGTPKAFIGRFVGTHPSVMCQRIEAHPFNLDEHSESWRMQYSFKEWRRIFESFFYKVFGMPKWRIKRATLLGKLVKKDRDAESVPL